MEETEFLNEYLKKILDINNKFVIWQIEYIFKMKKVFEWDDEKLLANIKEAILYINKV